MGKTASIQDLAKRESEYRDYLDKLEKQLVNKSATEEADLQKRIDKFYKDNKYDKIDFVSGKNHDFMQQADWSLSNVKNIIDTIGKAIFGGDKKLLPPGVSVNDKVPMSMTAMQDLQIYIASKCFDVISGIIESFGNSTSVSYSSSYKDVSLGNGLHLFATVSCDSYKSTSFFNNEEIYQYLYIYQVAYSAAEAETEGKIVATQVYEDEIVEYKRKLERYIEQLDNDTISLEQYKTLRDNYQSFIDDAMKQLEKLKK